MLQALTLTDYVLFDRMDIEFGANLNVISGETGAGKSILLGALDLLLGGEANPSLIRAGAERAVVEGLFGLSPELRATLVAVGLEEDAPVRGTGSQAGNIGIRAQPLFCERDHVESSDAPSPRRGAGGDPRSGGQPSPGASRPSARAAGCLSAGWIPGAWNSRNCLQKVGLPNTPGGTAKIPGTVQE